MKKEVILAILIGLVFGLVIVFGVHQAQQATTDRTTTSQVEETDSEDEDQDDGSLAIHSPEDQIIVEEVTTSVTGTTLPDVFVVVFVNNKETITTADSSGNFSVDVELDDGSNVIAVHIVTEDGDTVIKERTVIVTDEPLTSDASTTSQDEEETEATDSAETEE